MMAQQNSHRSVAANPAVGSPVPRGACSTEGFRTHVALDADDHAANLTGWSQLYDQLVPGRFHGSVNELWIGKLQLFCETTSHAVQQSCQPWSDSLWFGIPLHQDGVCKLNGDCMDEAAVAVRSADFDLLTPNNFAILGIVVDRRELAEYVEAVEHASLPHSFGAGGCLYLEEHRGAIARNLFQQILKETAESPSVLTHAASRRAIRDSILRALFELCSIPARASKSTATHSSRYALVTRIRDYALSMRDQPVTVPEICRNFYVSRRTLQNAFHDVVGMSPAAYLRALRLNGVRRRLRDHGPTVTAVQDAAAEWGFWHLSQFAQDYRRWFGELPSESLRRGFERAAQ